MYNLEDLYNSIKKLNRKVCCLYTDVNVAMVAPKMTTAQRTAIVSPEEGRMVYDTDLHKLYVYNGTSWQATW